MSRGLEGINYCNPGVVFNKARLKLRHCPFCNAEVYDDSIRCFNCGKSLASQKNICSVCGVDKKSGRSLFIINEIEYCQECAISVIEKIKVTTTPNFEGSAIRKYIGVEAVEVILGTGIWSETQTGIANLFGSRATAMEEKLNQSKADGMAKIKMKAFSQGANAIVGMQLTYTQFASNMTGVVISGTLVEIE